MGHIHDTLKYMDAALKLAQKLGITRELMVVLLEYGRILQGMNRREEALTMFKQAEPHARTVDDAQASALIQEKIAAMESSQKV
jgi:hypothetical protein